MQKYSELKPCPFCGSSFVEVEERYHIWVSCQVEPCLAEGPMRLTRDEAVRAWNTRKEPHDSEEK